MLLRARLLPHRRESTTLPGPVSTLAHFPVGWTTVSASRLARSSTGNPGTEPRKVDGMDATSVCRQLVSYQDSQPETQTKWARSSFVWVRSSCRPGAARTRDHAPFFPRACHSRHMKRIGCISSQCPPAIEANTPFRLLYLRSGEPHSLLRLPRAGRRGPSAPQPNRERERDRAREQEQEQGQESEGARE